MGLKKKKRKGGERRRVTENEDPKLAARRSRAGRGKTRGEGDEDR